MFFFLWDMRDTERESPVVIDFIGPKWCLRLVFPHSFPWLQDMRDRGVFFFGHRNKSVAVEMRTLLSIPDNFLTTRESQSGFRRRTWLWTLVFFRRGGSSCLAFLLFGDQSLSSKMMTGKMRELGSSDSPLHHHQTLVSGIQAIYPHPTMLLLLWPDSITN